MCLDPPLSRSRGTDKRFLRERRGKLNKPRSHDTPRNFGRVDFSPSSSPPPVCTSRPARYSENFLQRGRVGYRFISRDRPVETLLEISKGIGIRKKSPALSRARILGGPGGGEFRVVVRYTRLHGTHDFGCLAGLAIRQSRKSLRVRWVLGREAGIGGGQVGLCAIPRIICTQSVSGARGGSVLTRAKGTGGERG